MRSANATSVLRHPTACLNFQIPLWLTQVWEDGHIQLEVTRKDGSSCHEGQINQLVAEEGELITIGNKQPPIFSFRLIGDIAANVFDALDRQMYLNNMPQMIQFNLTGYKLHGLTS